MRIPRWQGGDPGTTRRDEEGFILSTRKEEESHFADIYQQNVVLLPTLCVYVFYFIACIMVFYI